MQQHYFFFIILYYNNAFNLIIDIYFHAFIAVKLFSLQSEFNSQNITICFLLLQIFICKTVLFFVPFEVLFLKMIV